EQTLHAVEAAGEDEIRTRLARDPWASAGLLRVGPIEPWALWLDGRGLDGRGLDGRGARRPGLGRAGEAGRPGADGAGWGGAGWGGAGWGGDRGAGPAHAQDRGLRVLAVGLRDPRRAAPDAERRDRRRD